MGREDSSVFFVRTPEAWPLIPKSRFTYLNRRYQVVSDAVQCASFKMHLKIGQTRSRNANPARTEPEHNQEG